MKQQVKSTFSLPAAIYRSRRFNQNFHLKIVFSSSLLHLDFCCPPDHHAAENHAAEKSRQQAVVLDADTFRSF